MCPCTSQAALVSGARPPRPPPLAPPRTCRGGRGRLEREGSAVPSARLGRRAVSSVSVFEVLSAVMLKPAGPGRHGSR